MIKIDQLCYESLIREAEMILMQGKGPVSIINMLARYGLSREDAKLGAKELFEIARERVMKRQRLFFKVSRVIMSLACLVIPYAVFSGEYKLLTMSFLFFFLSKYLKSNLVIPPKLELFDALQMKE